MEVIGSVLADPEVVATEVEGGAALLDLRTSQYYGLNAVGSFVGAQPQAPKTLDQLAAADSEGFAVEAAACRADIARLLEDFARAGLVKRDA